VHMTPTCSGTPAVAQHLLNANIVFDPFTPATPCASCSKARDSDLQGLERLRVPGLTTGAGLGRSRGWRGTRARRTAAGALLLQRLGTAGACA